MPDATVQVVPATTAGVSSKKRAVWAVWVMTALVGSTSTSTNVENLVVHDDGDKGVFETQHDAARTLLHMLLTVGCLIAALSTMH